MPIYEFYCEKCKETKTEFFKMADKPAEIPCDCGGKALFAISCPMIQCDDPVNTPWLREFCNSHNRQAGKRNRFGGKPLQSRTDYKEYLDTHNLRDPAKGENLVEI